MGIKEGKVKSLTVQKQKQGLVAHACYPSTQQAAAEGLQIQGQTLLATQRDLVSRGRWGEVEIEI